MDLNKKQFTTEVAGKKLTLEVSDIAKQANAAVLGTYGDTSVLVTATMSQAGQCRSFRNFWRHFGFGDRHNEQRRPCHRLSSFSH